jgi:ATP-dependent Clp protease ATP-binding subunit ClpA
MLHSCNNLSEDLKTAIALAAEESARHNNTRTGTEHLLLGLSAQPEAPASLALALMKIDRDSLQKELEKLIAGKDYANYEAADNALPGNAYLHRLTVQAEGNGKVVPFSDELITTLTKADLFSRYLGEDKINTAHVLLAMLELKNTCARRIFEELSANLDFLKGKIMQLIAANHFKAGRQTSFRNILINCLKQLVEKHEAALYVVQELMQRSKIDLLKLPEKDTVMQTVCIAYLPDCIVNQVSFQRYLLEEGLRTISSIAGTRSQDSMGQIISSTAQHLRKQAREAIEYIWTDEYRLIKHMLSDAEHDLIGSLIEDLWWAYSEDIALDQSFTSALADHRRSHLLDLQKRRLELSQRLRKLHNRLEETVKQCFANKVGL